MDTQVDNYHCSSTRSAGFKAILSSPTDTPKVSDYGIFLSPGFETRIAIDPLVREATESLRSIPVKKRQCYFTNERQLQYYRTYTQGNCLLECQSKYTLKNCNCVPYYLPKNKTIRYCGKADKECVGQAKLDMEQVDGNSSSCHCLAGCIYVKYTNAKSFSLLAPKVNYDFPNITPDYFVRNIAAVHYYFSNTKFLKELKSELYSFTEILSNTGGLLSLCLGFSFLSLVEVLYFISFRVACETKHSTRKRNRPAA